MVDLNALNARLQKIIIAIELCRFWLQCAIPAVEMSMTKERSDFAKLTWIEPFVAAAAYGNYSDAGMQLGINATTVSRSVVQLEKWLSRVLITTDVPFDLTEDGEAFVPVALRLVELIDQTGLKSEISKTRVQADGTITIGGEKINMAGTAEIGQLLVASRAAVDPDYVEPPRLSGSDIDMSFWKPADPKK